MCCCNYLYSVQTNTDITLPNVCYDARESRIVIEVCVCTMSIAINISLFCIIVMEENCRRICAGR